MLRTIPTAAMICLSAVTTAPAQDTIPDDVLQRLKDATVFVTVHVGRVKVTGSGFLFQREGDVGYVVTNQHVIAARPEQRRRVRAVFWSGTSQERTVSATVLGEDPDRDLAILQVVMGDLPAPLSLSAPTAPRETLPVFILGFPFGEALSLTRDNPAVTIGKGSVSSIRRDEFGNLARVQIDGDINPGNSGGPIVNAEGALVGVAVSTVRGTRIGLAIPVEQLDLMLIGRIGEISLDELENTAGIARVQVVLRLIDPFAKLKRATVLIIPRENAPHDPQPDARGMVGALAPTMTEFELALEGDSASGEMKLKGDVRREVVYRVQAKVQRADGTAFYSHPTDFTVDYRLGVARPAPEPVKPRPRPGDDWLGSKAERSRRDALAAGEPLATGENLAGTPRTVVDTQVTPIKVNAKNTVPELCLSDDGSYLFTLEKHGLVRRISLPDMVEQAQLPIGYPCSGLARSSAGLIVLVEEQQQLWVLDDETLRVRSRVPVGPARAIAAIPALPIAFVTACDDELALIDVSLGQVVKRFHAHDLRSATGTKLKRHKTSAPLSQFLFPTMSPDGKFLFCQSGDCLQRLRIDGRALRYEEAGPRIANNGQSIVVSPDSRYVVLPSGGGNYNVDDHPQVGWYATYVYKVDDLRQPVATVQSGAYPRTFAFDPTAELIYAQGGNFNLITFAPDGVRLKEYPLGRGRTMRLGVHPGGNRLVVLTEEELFWVHVPDARKSTQDLSVATAQVTGTSVRGDTRTVVDAAATRLEIPGKKTVANLLWSDGAQFVYVLQKGGILRKIAVPALVEERRLEIGYSCSWLERARVGLVVAVRGLQELWVLDPDTLALRKRIVSPGVRRFVTSPALAVAFVMSAPPYTGGHAVDLESGRISDPFTAYGINKEHRGSIRRHDKANLLKIFEQPVITPNGAYLFCISTGSLQRLRVSGTRLIYEEAGPSVSASVSRPVISDDSRYVSLPSRHTVDVGGHPNRHFPGVYVYDVTNLQTPLLSIPLLNVPRTTAFDRTAGKLYGQDSRYTLIPCTREGIAVKQYRLTRKDDMTRQFLVHPDGDRLFALTKTDLLWVELPPGSNAAARSVAEVGARVEEPGVSLVAETQNVNGAVARRLTLNAEHVVGDWMVSADGRFLYGLERGGILRQVALPDLVETRRLTLGHKGTCLARCRSGLLVAVSNLQELWVVDEPTLEVRARIPVAGVRLVVASPNGDVAFGLPEREGPNMTIVDVAQGRSAAVVDARQIWAEHSGDIRKYDGNHHLSNFRRPAVSPDGKYLFCVSSNCLHRFRIVGTELHYEEEGPPIWNSGLAIAFDPEGRYVTAPGGGGNRQIDGHPQVDGHASYVYRIDDLQAPAFTLVTGQHPRCLGFDTAGGLIYGTDYENQLVTLDWDGRKQGEYPLTKRGDSVWQFLVHPEGRRLLVRTGDHLVWVELPE